MRAPAGWLTLVAIGTCAVGCRSNRAAPPEPSADAAAAVEPVVGDEGSEVVTVRAHRGERLELRSSIEHGLQDNRHRFELTLHATDRPPALLFAGATEHLSPPRVTTLPGGRLGLAFQSYVCQSDPGGPPRCADMSDLSSTFYPERSCCDEAAGDTICRCGIEESDRSLAPALRWAAADAPDGMRTTGAAVALTVIGDAHAAAAVQRLLALWPDNLWLRAMGARLWPGDPARWDDTASASLGAADLETIVERGSHDARLTLARACVPALRGALTARLPSEPPEWRAELVTALSRCDP